MPRPRLIWIDDWTRDRDLPPLIDLRPMVRPGVSCAMPLRLVSPIAERQLGRNCGVDARFTQARVNRREIQFMVSAALADGREERLARDRERLAARRKGDQ